MPCAPSAPHRSLRWPEISLNEPGTPPPRDQKRGAFTSRETTGGYAEAIDQLPGTDAGRARALAELEQAFSPQPQLDPAETVALAEALARRNSELASNLRSGKARKPQRESRNSIRQNWQKRSRKQRAISDSRRLQELAAQKPVSAKLMLENTLSSSSSETGRRFASVLQSVKSGLQIPEHEREKGTGGVATAPARKHPDGSGDDGAEPTGEPGSEKDVGRGRSCRRTPSRPSLPQIARISSRDKWGKARHWLSFFRRPATMTHKRAAPIIQPTTAQPPPRSRRSSESKFQPAPNCSFARYFESIRPKE